MRPRIDVEIVAEWARQVLAQGKPADDGCGVELTIAQIQEYNLAHAITVDGIFQDRDQEAADRPWWKVWSR
jgi:hypothetical protein